MQSREPSSLDIFLLALIDSGLTTPYEFQRQAGISVGAAIPALKYLLRKKLVTRGKQGERGRMEYSLTREGNALLKAQASSPFEGSDFHSVLRSAVLSNYVGRKAQASRLLLEYRTQNIRTVPKEKLDLTSPAAIYRWMISVREHHQQKADLQAVSEIIRKLKQKLR